MTQEGLFERCKEDNLTSLATLFQDENGLIDWKSIEKVLKEEGLDLENDPRTKKILNKLSLLKPQQCKDDIKLTLYEFKHVLAEEEKLFRQALLRTLVIKDFVDFDCFLKQLYDNAQECVTGEIKKRGSLYQVTGDEWSVSLISTDGQKTSIGSSNTAFTLDELCAPLIHGLAIDLLGEDRVNELSHEAPKHAPGHKHESPTNGSHVNWFLTDLAMILMCSRIKATKIEAWSDPIKHDYVLSYIKGLCCGEELRFSNASYTQAKEADCQSLALAHFLKAFIRTKSLVPHIDSGLDLLFQLKSMEVTTNSLAMIGAVLANGGISPFDGQEMLSHRAVTGLLNAMYCGGFGKSSSLFAVKGGVPGICTEAGAVLVIIPGVCGLGLFSPKVECCCSIRSYSFVTELIKLYGYHPYCRLEEQVYLSKKGNIKKDVDHDSDALWPIFTAASLGDIDQINRYIDDGLNIMNLKDPSGLSLLHIAAAHGRLELVKILFCKAPDLLFASDSLNRRASDYAKTTGQDEVLEYLIKLETLTRSSLLASSLEPEK